MVDPATGWCKHLREDNMCEIYERRPDVCNVSKAYNDSAYKDRKEFYKLNNMYCNLFQEADGMDISFRINVSKYEED